MKGFGRNSSHIIYNRYILDCSQEMLHKVLQSKGGKKYTARAYINLQISEKIHFIILKSFKTLQNQLRWNLDKKSGNIRMLDGSIKLPRK